MSTTALWGLILGGGDGKRLQPLTSRISGDGRPKQFCPIFEGETLLDRTRRRVDLLVRPDRQAIVVTRSHEPYYRRLYSELAPSCLVVQPANRDTGPGILYPLLRIMELAGNVPLAIFPSDHFVSDDRLFMEHVRDAWTAVRSRPDLIVLLGIEATRAETDYGWIQPAAVPVQVEDQSVFPICSFWEKPSALLAHQLFTHGCLWNSFVMVTWAQQLLDLIRSTAPELSVPFEQVRRRLGKDDEVQVIEHVYAQIRPTGFSDAVLARAPRRLSTLRVKNLEWSDWGNAQRVVETLKRAKLRPSWLSRLEPIALEESA
jgi:mannose-1-phosphate guanylyltransferase